MAAEKIISENIFSKNIYLDLTNLSIVDLPEEIYQANHSEGIYLSNNKLQNIPLKFFQNYPKLKILDLRFNLLNDLPDEIGQLNSLEILLLDGNNLSALPKGLASLTNLRGLNIGTNPLVDLNCDFIKHGYKSILHHLSDFDNSIHFSSNNKEVSLNRNIYNYSDEDKETRFKSVEKLFKPKIYKEIHQSYLIKNRQSNGAKQKEIVTQSDKHNSLVNLYPEPVSLENIERRMIEQNRLEMIKEVTQKREAELQRAKNKAITKEWRDEAKDLQSFKRRQQANKLPLEIKFESDNRILNAPFKIEKEFLETITGEELDQQKQSAIKDVPKPQPLEKEMQLILEAERRNRQKTIQSDIKRHSEYLVNKRNMPKGSAKEELETAKRDMEIAMKLHKEIQDNIYLIK